MSDNSAPEVHGEWQDTLSQISPEGQRIIQGYWSKVSYDGRDQQVAIVNTYYEGYANGYDSHEDVVLEHLVAKAGAARTQLAKFDKLGSRESYEVKGTLDGIARLASDVLNLGSKTSFEMALADAMRQHPYPGPANSNKAYHVWRNAATAHVAKALGKDQPGRAARRPHTFTAGQDGVSCTTCGRHDGASVHGPHGAAPKIPQ